MFKIAHRGARKQEKENTIAAFKKALALGADMIELDIRRSKDGQVLVIHDDLVGNLTLAQVRQQKWGPAVPTLKEALVLLKNKCQLDIELKETPTLEPTIALIKKLKMGSSVVLTSFDHQLILRLKQKHPAFRAGFIIGNKEKNRLASLLALAVKNKIEVLVIRSNLLSSGLLKKARQNKLEVYAWTVNDKKRLRRLLKLGLDGIATDDLTLF